jgi:hypothetical protein
MARPQVVIVPALAGIGSNPPTQIPLSGGTTITIVNQNNYLGLTLCETESFEPSTTWSLPASASMPQTGMNTLFAQNSSNYPVTLLVYTGVLPISFTPFINQPFANTYIIPKGTASTTITIETQPAWTVLWVALQSYDYAANNAISIQVSGNQSFVLYRSIVQPPGTDNADGFYYYRVRLYPGLDSSISLIVQPSGTAAGGQVWYGVEIGTYDTAVYAEGGFPLINIGNPPNSISEPPQMYPVGGNEHYYNAALPIGLTTIMAAPTQGAFYRYQLRSMNKESTFGPGLGVELIDHHTGDVLASLLDTGSATTPHARNFLNLGLIGSSLSYLGGAIDVNNTSGAPMKFTLNYERTYGYSIDGFTPA